MSEKTAGGARRPNALTDGPLRRSLLRFTVPFLLSNLLQTLYGTVDTLVIGNYGSTAGVSAVATGAQALSLITFFLFGLAGGSTVLIGQYTGGRADRDAARVTGGTVVLFSALSLAMTALLLAAYPALLELLNIPPEAVGEAGRYMRVCSLGIPLITGYNITSALLNATGDSKSPLLFVGIACVCNIAGDILLTGALGMGAEGVAAATVSAQGISFVFSLLFLRKKRLPYAFSAKDIRLSPGTALDIARIGVPMGVQSILVNVSFLFITAIINSMGVTASAAMGIGDKITGFAFMPQSAFAASVAVVVAQNKGAGKPRRAWEAVRISVAVCFAVEAVFLIVCQAAPELLPGLFTQDGEVRRMCGQYMRAYAIDAVLTACTFCLSGYLNGNGRTGFNMVQNLAATFLGRVPATYLFSRLPGADLFLIGLAAPASTVLSLVMLGLYIRRMRREEAAL